MPMKKRTRRKGKKHIWLRVLMLILSVAFCIGAVFVFRGYTMYKKALRETPVAEMRATIQNSAHYTRLSELPDIYPKAVLAAEDHRFYQHGAIDIVSIIRAAWRDIASLSLKEGGSTITQQFAKNEYFTQERKLERKVAEIFMAYEIERVCSKDEILEMYINTIYYGAGHYSIYDAAEGYFECSPSELSDGQCVLLAGLPNAPSVYALTSNPDLAVQRQAQVLEKMVKYGYITADDAEKIKAGQVV